MSRTLARSLSAAVCVAALAGCAHAPQPMYEWGAFSHQQYDTLRGEGQGAAEQIQALEAQSAKAATTHTTLPPGLRAHLGMLYLDTGNPGRARELWLDEKNAFPESTPYIDQLLARLEGSAPPAQPGGTS